MCRFDTSKVCVQSLPGKSIGAVAGQAISIVGRRVVRQSGW